MKMTDQQGMDEPVEYMDCGLVGSPDAPVTHSEMNRYIRRILLHHVIPVKKQLADVHKALYNEQDGLVHVRNWLRTFAFRLGAFIVGATTTVAAFVVIGKNLNWW